MSECFWGKIYIGGDVHKDLLKDLYDKIIDEVSYLEKISPKQSYSSWFKRYIAKGVLVFEDSEARYGQFEDTEAFLEQNNIPYIRQSSTYGEFEPEMVYFNGDKKITLITNNDNMPIVQVDVIKKWCKKAIELHEEFKKGNAPLYIDNDANFPTIDGIMAMYSLKAKQVPSSTELVLAILNDQYPDIGKLPNFIIKE